MAYSQGLLINDTHFEGVGLKVDVPLSIHVHTHTHDYARHILLGTPDLITVFFPQFAANMRKVEEKNAEDESK